MFLSNGVIYVEGKTDALVFTRIARAICPNWDEYNISIVSLGGNNIEDIAKTLPSNGFAHLNPNALLVIDSDGTELDENGICKPADDKKKIKEKFMKFGIETHILQKREIENYIEPEVIKDEFELSEVPELQPNIDVPEFLRKKYGLAKWANKKTEFTPKLFGAMIKRKKVPLEFKQILEKAIIKCGFEPMFSDEFTYV